jgi:hypothetical protein
MIIIIEQLNLTNSELLVKNNRDEVRTICILKVGVKESIVNAPRIKSNLTFCVVCVFIVSSVYLNYSSKLALKSRL